ncbi:uncharacterized protein LOC142554681 [Primulina tabacum]|uniref:uncharacterized protein LOC142554681 n=1 Tax=Primulina tabacum TaxID=48773 RepID=UPI003F590704
MNPEDFRGTTDPFVVEGWIRSLEVIFCYMDMADADRVRCTIYLLKGDASLWWEVAKGGVNLETLTWEDFKRVFYDKYFTSDVRSRLKRELTSLRQGDLSVAEFVQKIYRCCHFVPLIANDAVEKLRHFLDGLRPTICRYVMLTDPADYITAVAKAFRAEQLLKDIDYEMQRKRNRAQQANPQSSQQSKKPFIGPPKRPGQPKPQGQPPKENVPRTAEKPQCKDCNRQHYGKCIKCGEMGHKARDCPKLKQPTTRRAYVMHAEQAEPDTTLIIGRILLAGIATYALLDSGATHYFIYESFVKKLGILQVDVESGFRVTVPSDEHMASSSMVKDVELKLQKNII